MNRKVLPLMLLVTVLISQEVNAQEWVWARGGLVGGEGYFCATDASNNVYIGSEYYGEIHFGHDIISGTGSFIAKYDSLGNEVWAVAAKCTDSLGVFSSAYPIDLKTDIFNNVYLLGVYDTTLMFGTHILPVPGPRNNYYFIAKINSSGVVKWIKNIGNIVKTYESGYGLGNMTTDDNGSVYVSCQFSNSGAVGGYPIINASSDSSSDIFVGKFDSSGNLNWAKRFGGKYYDYPGGIAVGSSHNIYIAGYFYSDSLSFGSISLRDTGASHGDAGFYIAKLDGSGNTIWAKSEAGNSSFDNLTAIAANSSDELFITGSYYGAALNLSSHVLPVTLGGTCGFVAKYDPLGNLIWADAIKGISAQPWTIALDPCGNVWTTVGVPLGDGSDDTIDGHIVPLPISPDAMFIAGWNSTGIFITAATLPSGGDDYSNLAVDNSGNIYVGGDFEIDTFIVAHDTIARVGFSETNFIAKFNPNLGCHTNLINDPILNSKVVLFPNPSSSKLFITSSDKVKSVAITNLLGQTVYTIECNAKEVQIDVFNLPAGVYLVKINGNEVRKFVKL